MRKTARVTFLMDKCTEDLFNRMKAETKMSQSELVRRALWFYSENRNLLASGNGRINTYVEMLSEVEHIILDVDHWHLFLELIGESQEKEFSEVHKNIAKSHGEQLSQKVHSVEELLERLETCNFYKLRKISEDEFTLILRSEICKRFVKTFLEEALTHMGFKIEIKEDFAKLRLRILK